MKILLTFIFIALSVISVFGQKDVPVLDINGKQVDIGKGWKLIYLFPDENDRVYLTYTYKADTLIKIAPNHFKFWVKIKDYREKKKDYELLLTEVKCNVREYRVNKFTDYFFDGTSDSLNNPENGFEDPEPDSLFDKILSTVCEDVIGKQK